LEVEAANLVNERLTGLRSQLHAADERARFIRDNWLTEDDVVPQWLVRDMQESEAAKANLKKQLQSAEDQVQRLRQATKVLRGCGLNLVVAFDTLTTEHQAAVWRALVTNVKISVTRARGKNCRAWVQEWASANDPLSIQRTNLLQ